MNKVIKEENDLFEIENIDSYYLVKGNDKFYILKELTNECFFEIGKESFFDYFPLVEWGDKKFESISFELDIDKILIKKIFEFIVEKNCKLNVIYNEIEKIVLDFKEKIPLWILRSYFSEMKIMRMQNLQKNNFQNSIYDLTDGKNDIEIKSFSKVERKIYISYQQLTNNTKAKFILAEVYESRENGESIFEVYDNLEMSQKKEWSFINAFNKEFNSTKFVLGETIEKECSYFSEGLKLPKKAINASYTYKI